MKRAVLRAAVHNALDSFTSGCPLAFAIEDFDFPFWMLLWNMPDRVLEADILTGVVATHRPDKGLRSYLRLTNAMAVLAAEMPSFLRKHGCTPNAIDSVLVRFENNWTRRQWVTVTIVLVDGTRLTDAYHGTPLRRRRIRDQLGRVRVA